MSSGVEAVIETHSISRKQLRTQIALAGIGENGQDAFSFSQFLSCQASGVQDCTGRYAAQNAFHFSEPAAGIARVIVGDGNQSIDNFPIKNLRHESGANTLNLVGTRFASREYGRVCRFDGVKFEVGYLLLDDLARAGSGSTGSDADDKCVEFTSNHLQNLACRSSPMYVRIGRILKLLRHEVVRMFL